MTDVNTYHDGRLEIRLTPREMRMSHWVHAPTVTDLETGRVLLDLSDGLWDLMAVHEAEYRLDLHLRRYPGDRAALTLSITLGDNRLWMGPQEVSPEHLEAVLDAAVL
ncbi:hypothetical protein BK634_16660 [Pseudomonas chlororaphis]|nr:hypothetical protein BK634_16660 [Pseudomonas chlororaphis]